MPIKINAGPAQGRAVMQQALASRRPRAAAFSTPLGGAPQTGAPVPVYHLRLDQVADEQALALARPVGWRYPVIGGLEPGLADVRDPAPGQSAPAFGGLSQGLLARRFVQAAALATRALDALTEEFEPRLLDVPALQYMALWLHGTQHDHFVSLLDGNPPGSAPLQLVDDVLGALRARAAARPHAAPPFTPSGGGVAGRTPTN